MAAVVIGALAALALSPGGSGGDPEVRTLSTTVTESQSASDTSTSSPENEAAASDSVATIEEPELELVSGDFGFAHIPVGWIQEKTDEQAGPRVVNQWREPADPETSVLIDAQTHPGASTRSSPE
jgi:hypothetical protein